MVEHLQPRFRNKSHTPHEHGFWRLHSSLFHNGCRWLPGEIDVSTGRQGPGHKTERPGITADLRTLNYRGALQKGRNLECLASALLYVLHPKLYLQFRECLALILQCAQDKDKKFIREWGSVYTALDVIVNRETPLHLDKEPLVGWLDIMMTIGSYHSCLLTAPTLGQNFSYLPGTVIALNSSRVVHGATMADGERACFVFYLRLHVAEYFHRQSLLSEIVGGCQLMYQR